MSTYFSPFQATNFDTIVNPVNESGQSDSESLDSIDDDSSDQPTNSPLRNVNFDRSPVESESNDADNDESSHQEEDISDSETSNEGEDGSTDSEEEENLNYVR